MASAPTQNDVIQTGPDTYIISAYSAFNGTSKKDAIIRIANDFAASKGKQAVTISMKESHPSIGFGGQFEYQFSLVEIPAAKVEQKPVAATDQTAKSDRSKVDKLYEDLLKLADLKMKGIITDEEFNIQKSRLLEGTRISPEGKNANQATASSTTQAATVK